MPFYAANGSWNVSVVDGNTRVGLRAANGSTNVVLSSVSGGWGMYHPCGALRVTVATGSNGVGRYAYNGSMLVSETGLYNAQRVTVVSGSLTGEPGETPTMDFSINTNSQYVPIFMDEF